MTPETALLWSWLNILLKKRYDALLKVYGGLDEATSHIDEEMLKGLGCREETIYETLNRLEEFDPSMYQKEMEKRGIELISIENDKYPATLKSIEDAPVFLNYRGSLDVLQQPCIALVGTRDMSDYGRRVTEEFSSAIVQSGAVTVSGLATGVDTTVAKETLRNNGNTVAVLGHGFAYISPVANKKLADEIVESGGLILSEYPLDLQGDKYTFPARNRIVAGLSLATVVLEAPEGSGALITADLALGYGRDVFAVPGQIFDTNYAGSHQAIARGQAKLASDPAVILKEVGIVTSETNATETFEPENDIESAIWHALTSMPQSVGDISEKAKLETAVLNSTLTIMELRGVVRNIGGRWIKK